MPPQQRKHGLGSFLVKENILFHFLGRHCSLAGSRQKLNTPTARAFLPEHLMSSRTETDFPLFYCTVPLSSPSSFPSPHSLLFLQLAGTLYSNEEQLSWKLPMWAGVTLWEARSSQTWQHRSQRKQNMVNRMEPKPGWKLKQLPYERYGIFPLWSHSVTKSTAYLGMQETQV